MQPASRPLHCQLEGELHDPVTPLRVKMDCCMASRDRCLRTAARRLRSIRLPCLAYHIIVDIAHFATGQRRMAIPGISRTGRRFTYCRASPDGSGNPTGKHGPVLWRASRWRRRKCSHALRSSSANRAASTSRAVVVVAHSSRSGRTKVRSRTWRAVASSTLTPSG